MKITAFILALLMVFSLTACAPKKGNTTNKNNKNNNTSDINGDSSDAAGSGSTDGNNTGNDSSMGGSGSKDDDGKDPADADGTPSFGEDYRGDRRFYYAGRLYHITNETVDKDEVGGELFSITDMVENDPAAEGEGFGLDLNTNIYKFREENQYDELVVLIGEKFYKAEVVENDPIKPDTGNGGINNGGNSENKDSDADVSGN